MGVPLKIGEWPQRKETTTVNVTIPWHTKTHCTSIEFEKTRNLRCGFWSICRFESESRNLFIPLPREIFSNNLGIWVLGIKVTFLFCREHYCNTFLCLNKMLSEPLLMCIKKNKKNSFFTLCFLDIRRVNRIFDDLDTRANRFSLGHSLSKLGSSHLMAT